MGKSVSSTTKLQEFAKLLSSHNLQRPKHTKPTSRNRVSTPDTARPKGIRVDPESLKPTKMQSLEGQDRMPLAKVVSDCARRWFEDTLKEAKAGDINMQVLVGQMYFSGYGVPRDVQMGRAWMNRASKSRSSVWRVSDKHPGFNASDSDSDELKGNEK